VIDLHTHLLPGVDDGSPSLDVSLPVLERFGAEGVEVLVCTPHLDASQAAEAPIARNAEIFARLVERAPARPALLLGWEIM
jgi:protein-tyrosine phosphatase